MHPLSRAHDATRMLFDIRDIARTGTDLTPDVKRDVDDLLSDRVMGEYRNALIAIGHEGYGSRKQIDLNANLALIREIAPDIARRVTDMQGKVAAAQTVADLYPDVRAAALAQFAAIEAELASRQQQ